MNLIDKLNQVLAIAKEIPFYQKRVIVQKFSSEEDLGKISVLNKEDLRRLTAMEMISSEKKMIM